MTFFDRFKKGSTTAPELLDARRVQESGDVGDETYLSGDRVQFPDILPSDDAALVELRGKEISRRIAEYRGVTVRKLHTILVSEGFLARGESVGELILHDARTLRDLGVSRHELARALHDAFLLDLSRHSSYLYLSSNREGLEEESGLSSEELDELLGRGKRDLERIQSRLREAFDLQLDEKTGEWLNGEPPYSVDHQGTRGHHRDPFHSVDTYYLSPEVGGSADVVISGKAGKIRLGDMHPYLIRRACFFEGTGRYRLDPKQACEVLGLV